MIYLGEIVSKRSTYTMNNLDYMYIAMSHNWQVGSIKIIIENYVKLYNISTEAFQIVCWLPGESQW